MEVFRIQYYYSNKEVAKDRYFICVSSISGEIASRNHYGGHTNLFDSPVFLEFI
jgi:hypothetical protein